MKEITRQALLTLVVFAFILYSSLLKAQQNVVAEDLKNGLSLAEAHLQAFRNDSALAVTGDLLRSLKVRGQLDTPFAIRVLLAEGMALENDEQGDIALKKLLYVEQQSQKYRLGDVHVKACLALALLYEKNGLTDSSKKYLDLAEADINRYGLDLDYAYFAIRRASWERLFGKKDTALLFARESLKAASKHGLVLEKAISHMLLNMLLPKSSVDARMHHSLAAVKLYQQLGDHAGCSYMFEAVSKLYFQQRKFPQALAYNDSALLSANRSIAAEHTRHALIGSTYRFRGSIFKEMGLPDSALANIQRGFELDLKLKEEDVKDKIVEIESRYQDKYKEQQLEENRLAIQLKNSQLRFSGITVFLVLILTVSLFFGYRKQKQDKRKLIEQNTLIYNQTVKLEALDAAKSRFFANVSHELRTPLALIIGPVGTLLNENHLTERQADLLKFVHRSSRQLENMFTAILDLGKMETGKMKLDEKPTPVAAFFGSHFAQFESLADSNGLAYSYAIHVSKDLRANLDQVKCGQILNNLLANSFKFTPRGKQITATLSLVDDRLHLCITDSGIGIHPDDLPYIFDRYFQTTKRDKPAEGGTGIGLALCHDYIQLMNGQIEAESIPGYGSTFRVVLPIILLPDANEPGTDTGQIAQTANTFHKTVSLRALTTGETGGALPMARPTILVVEDNLDLQVYIRLILADRYRVLTAGNGKDALELIRTEGSSGISLILSDLMMPVMDGHQLLARLKSEDTMRHIPVVMLTARADLQDKLRALRIGVDDYLLKPFEEEELLARIDNLLANQAARILSITYGEEPGSPGPVMSQADRSWLETFERYVENNLTNPVLSVPELAHHFAMSESTLLRQLKRLTGLSPAQYVQAVRLEGGRRLLENGTFRSITQVAAQVGYADVRSFSRSFRMRFGKLPSELPEA